MNHDTVQSRLASFERPEDAIGHLHFHGTLEDFDDPLRPSGFDGCLWLADTPAVAQTYIPATGGSTLLTVDAFAMNERVRPTIEGPSGQASGYTPWHCNWDILPS